MILNKLILVSTSILLITSGLEARGQNIQESDQQISDFSLAGFGEKGKKTWDISGKSADIFTDIVKLKDIVSYLYKEEEQIKLTADKGDFDKGKGKVHLEDNVVITTSSGARLTTDSLDWDRKNQIVTTKDALKLERENMITTALGAKAEPNLNKVTLEKDVTVSINPATADSLSQAAEGNNKIIITCDGPVTIDYAKNIATFNKNVKVDRGDSQIYSDTMDIYFKVLDEDKTGNLKQTSKAMGGEIEKIIARGNVKVVRGQNISYSDEAVYDASTKKITLSGTPKLVIYSTEGLNAPSGN